MFSSTKGKQLPKSAEEKDICATLIFGIEKRFFPFGDAFVSSLVIGIISLTFLLKFNKNGELGDKCMLKIALPNDIRSLDSALSFEKNTSHVMNMIFEGLMRRGANDVPQLAIAESFDISRDQKHYIFQMRDCKWSDEHQLLF